MVTEEIFKTSFALPISINKSVNESITCYKSMQQLPQLVQISHRAGEITQRNASITKTAFMLMRVSRNKDSI